MPKIHLTQKNMEFEVASGANLMNALIASGLPVASSCLGEGVCSMCRVKIKGQVSPAEKIEQESLTRNKCEPDERLSCQINVTSDISVSTKYW